MTAVKALFLTGQSNPNCCGLSPDQQRVAEHLQIKGATVANLNFPYDTSTGLYQPMVLWRASLANGLQYWRSRYPAFEHRYSLIFEAQLKGFDRYIILAGSCGLELFNNLRISPEMYSRIHVFAYGPVARKRPKVSHTLIQGTHDSLSRCFFGSVDHLIACDHMSYLQQPELLALLDIEVELALSNDKHNWPIRTLEAV